MVHQIKNCQLSMLQAYKQSLGRKLLGLYVPILILMYGFSAPFCPASSTQQLSDAYPYALAAATGYYQGPKGDLLDLSPSAPLGRMAVDLGKTYVTSKADNQFEQWFPTRNDSQKFDVVNLFPRVGLKLSSHYLCEMGAHCVKTGVMPNQEQRRKLFCRNILEVALSEISNSFLPDTDKLQWMIFMNICLLVLSG